MTYFSCLKTLAHLVPCSFHYALDTAAFKTSDSGTDQIPPRFTRRPSPSLLCEYCLHCASRLPHLVRLILLWMTTVSWQAKEILSTVELLQGKLLSRPWWISHVFSFILWYAHDRFRKSILSSTWQSWFCRETECAYNKMGKGRKGFVHVFFYGPAYR
jgi:hypothetical protein